MQNGTKGWMGARSERVGKWEGGSEEGKRSSGEQGFIKTEQESGGDSVREWE